MIVVKDKPISGPYDPVPQESIIVVIRIVIARGMSDQARPVVVHDMGGSGRIVLVAPYRAMPFAEVCSAAFYHGGRCRDCRRRGFSVHPP